MGFFKFLKLLKDCLTGLMRMHLTHLVHRDIKPENILLMNNNYCLADYGEGLNLFNYFQN